MAEKGDAPAMDEEDVRWRHEIALRHRVGSLALDVEFTLRAPWTALFAPSGGGKSTLLRLIAGLARPDAGRVVLRTAWRPMPESEIVLTDTAARVFVAPHRRFTRLLAQRPALFPHMSVRDNVRYRLARDAVSQLGRICTFCRINPLMDHLPWQLSGGERQRVALARVLAAGSGRLLLLDEPFTGMDAGLRAELIAELKPYLLEQGTPVLLVTHDVGEVFATGAEVIRLADGRVAAQGPAEEVLVMERAGLLRALRA